MKYSSVDMIPIKLEHELGLLVKNHGLTTELKAFMVAAYSTFLQRHLYLLSSSTASSGIGCLFIMFSCSDWWEEEYLKATGLQKAPGSVTATWNFFGNTKHSRTKQHWEFLLSYPKDVVRISKDKVLSLM